MSPRSRTNCVLPLMRRQNGGTLYFLARGARQHPSPYIPELCEEEICTRSAVSKGKGNKKFTLTRSNSFYDDATLSNNLAECKCEWRPLSWNCQTPQTSSVKCIPFCFETAMAPDLDSRDVDKQLLDGPHGDVATWRSVETSTSMCRLAPHIAENDATGLTI